MNRLINKNALVTGGTSGIGLESAREFLQEGARVAITGRNQRALEAAHKELGGKLLVITSDAAMSLDRRESLKPSVRNLALSSRQQTLQSAVKSSELVNSLAVTEQFQRCLEDARNQRVALHLCEERRLGFTHCQAGQILATEWNFSPDVIAAIEFHHNVPASSSAKCLVSIVHLSDLLCRLRDLGYGYYEAMGVDLAEDPAWATLLTEYADLGTVDIARLTMDIDGDIDEITAVVDSIFKPHSTAR